MTGRKKYVIEFRDVIGIEAYSPNGVDLCHIKVREQSEGLRRVCMIVDEDEEAATEYSFISAWSNLPILTIFGTFSAIKHHGNGVLH